MQADTVSVSLTSQTEFECQLSLTAQHCQIVLVIIATLDRNL